MPTKLSNSVRWLYRAAAVGAASVTFGANTSVVHADTDVTPLAKEIAHISSEVQGGMLAPFADPLIKTVNSSQFDWNQAMFGTDTLSSTQSSTKNAVLGDITQMMQFTATQEQDAEDLVNHVIRDLQSSDSSLTRQEAITFLTLFEQNALESMIGVANTAPAIESALYNSLASAESCSLVIQKLFGQISFTDVLQTKSSDSTETTITGTTGNTFYEFEIPASTLSVAQDVSVATTDLSTLVPPVGYTAVAALGLHFTTQNPSIPITLTVANSTIQSGAKVYKVSSDKWTMVSSTVTPGKAVLSFTSPGDFVIVNPIKLAPNQRAIYLNGKRIAVVPGAVKNNTVYMPVWYVMNALNQAGFHNTWDGTHWYLTAPTSTTPDLKNIKPGTGAKGIYLNNKLVQRIDRQALIDPTTGQRTTYMPMWYVMQALKRANVDSTWDGVNWNLITGR